MQWKTMDLPGPHMTSTTLAHMTTMVLEMKLQATKKLSKGIHVPGLLEMKNEAKVYALLDDVRGNSTSSRVTRHQQHYLLCMTSNNRSRTPPPGVDININSLRKMKQTRQMRQCKNKAQRQRQQSGWLGTYLLLCTTSLFHQIGPQ
jgi:hypothetical protein